ncbi:hypothetical protein DH2020_036175 [Rehmannia glutinosa]|uniref:F-box domain-containing protein n=1 Tax=Rehmannia glutinosa TaxID=99300 RepID=A0ABR0V5B8_REHGL
MILKNTFSKTADDEATKASSYVDDDLLQIDDLFREIFLRLPFRSLVRMKSVCKNWNSIISDLNVNSTAGLFFQYSDVNTCYAYVPFSLDKSKDAPPFVNQINKYIKDSSGIRILQSCNGLMLCRSDRASKNHRKYYICNPTTKEYSTLPRLVGRGGFSRTIRGLNLAFDPSKSPYYKVVCVRELGLCRAKEHQYQFEVYSSETDGGIWRKCGEPFTAQVNFKHGVCWNGAIHWISIICAEKSIYFNPYDKLMMPKVMPTPPVSDGHFSTRNYYFGESHDHLHYIDVCRMVTGFKVYEMKKDYSEWFSKYRVDLSYVVGYYLFSICTVVRGKKEKDSFLVLQVNPGKLIRYNLVCGTFETICEASGSMVQVHHPFTGPKAEFPLQYIESLSRV